MNLRPKRLGDELSLDEYNACQYLLYQSDCWQDNIFINTYIPRKGKFATYKLITNSILESEKQDHYRILREPTKNDILEIKLTNIEAKIENLHISPEIIVYHKQPATYNDGNGNPFTFDVTEYGEIDIWGADEEKETIYLETHYNKMVIPAEYDYETNRIKFSLFDGDGNNIPNGSLISKRIVISYKFNSKPYVDFRNGKANNNEEILVDNVVELEKLIKNAPTNGELVVFRLDSNVIEKLPPNPQFVERIGTYFLKKPLFIKAGQNIELRGGTNSKARINACYSKRCFVVKPDARLTLTNITCEYGNARVANYNTGKGGAILVEYGYDSFGILQCNDCNFMYNQAWYGGAIFSYHAGLHLNNCTFLRNTSYYDGGGINYQAKDVKMKLENVLTKMNTTVTLKATVTDNNNDITEEIINEGEVRFYIQKGGKDVYVGMSRVHKVGNVGVATVTHKTGTEIKTVEYPIIASYIGGLTLDSEVATATLKIKVPENYTISWEATDVSKVKVGDIITLNAKVVGNGGVISTTPTLSYKIGNTVYQAQKNGNLYTIVYEVKEADVNKDTKKLKITLMGVASPDYTTNVLTKEFTVDMEEEKQIIEGYLTGLYVNRVTPITEDMVDKWIEAKITDVYVRFNYKYDKTKKNMISANTIFQKDKYKDKIRLHAVINCMYDATESKWFSTTDTTRITRLKDEITYVSKNYPAVTGISLDYVRYSGGSSSDSTDKKVSSVNAVYKTLNEHIKSLNKNYIISSSVKAEDDSNKKAYGHDLKAITEYVDYIQPMIFKADYASWSSYKDSWVEDRLKYIIDTAGVDVKNIVVALQGYKINGSNYPALSKSNIDTTVKMLSSYKVKGIALFREGLVPTGYMTDYNSVMGESNNG